MFVWGIFYNRSHSKQEEVYYPFYGHIMARIFVLIYNLVGHNEMISAKKFPLLLIFLGFQHFLFYHILEFYPAWCELIDSFFS